MSTSKAPPGAGSRVACWPIGRVLDGALELAEVMGPEVGQELLDGAEAAGVDHEQVPGALPALVDQAGVTEHLQVPGYGLGGDVEVAGDVTDRTRGAGHQLEDDAPVRFGQRLEGRVRVHRCLPALPACTAC